MRGPPNLLTLTCFAVWAQSALAKSPGDYWQDTKDYVTAPVRWNSHEWTMAGGVLLGIAASYSVDRTVHDHAAPERPVNSSSRNRRDFVPLAVMFAGTLGAGVMGSDRSFVQTGVDMGESVFLSTLSAQALKLAFGRERPLDTTSPHRFGKGGSSFPSGHTTAAFAAAQVLADELDPSQWGWRWAAYGLAGATAYARLDSNAHWLSDTVAGAALGIATGRFVSNRRSNISSKLSLSVVPTHHGAMLAFAVDTN